MGGAVHPQIVSPNMQFLKFYPTMRKLVKNTFTDKNPQKLAVIFKFTDQKLKTLFLEICSPTFS